MEEFNITSKDVDKVSWFGYQSFIFTLVRSLTISIATYIMFKISQIETHLSTLIGIFISFIPFIIFLIISSNKYNLDIIDLNIKIFGKVFGNILNFIINITFIFLASLVLYNISQYVDIQYIPNTSTIYVKILILMPVIYAATKSISTISRISQVILFANLGIFILGITGLISEYKVNNILPIIDYSITKNSLLHSSIIFGISLISPVFLMTIIPQSKVEKKKYNFKKMWGMYIFSVLLVTVIIISTIFILGIDIINIYKYPIFMALRHFSLFTIIERIERFLSIQFIIDIILYLILSFYFISKSISKIISKKIPVNKTQNILPYIIGLITLVLSVVVFKESLTSDRIINHYFTYILCFGIILPMTITGIGVVIDKSKLN